MAPSSENAPRVISDINKFFLTDFQPYNPYPQFPRDRKWKNFPHALEETGNYDASRPRRPLTTLREFTMMQLMDTITDKPHWEEKVFNEEITAKWRAEISENEDLDVSSKMIDHIIEELKYKAKVFRDKAAVTAYDGDVVKSDTAIPESLKVSLRTAVAPLENIPEDQKDWHPGSDGQVLDLVHPSLFPLIRGRSRVVTDEFMDIESGISRSGSGQIIPGGPDFQWLPCEVKFKPDDGGRGRVGCKITSYINNLHPHDHSNLYSILENILDRVIPLWNMTLTPLDGRELETRISYRSPEYIIDPEDNIAARDFGIKEEEYDPDAFEGPEYSEDLFDWRKRMTEDPKNIVRPEPFSFRTPDGSDPETDLTEEFAEQGLQVIVKLANIHLTPEKPEYPGGTWHVEGTWSERICATALYYYDSSNITESQLAFRCVCKDAVEAGLVYEQDHRRWVPTVYGIEDEGANNQNVGSVNCREGRLLTFPNIFQHQVQPFSLADRTKPGHRKILAFFLIDPAHRVLSTANVPSQRKDWFEREISIEQETMKKLPPEVRMMVTEYLDDFPITMDEAKEFREQLMEQRKARVVDGEVEFGRGEFSLCEH